MVEIMDEKTFGEMVPLIDRTLQLLNGLINYYEKSKLK